MNEDLTLLGHALVTELPDAIIYADVAGIIRHWNAGATRIFGYTAHEAVGTSLDIIIPARLRTRHWVGFRRMLETGRSRHGEGDLLSVPAQTQSGRQISIQFTVALVRDEMGAVRGILAVLRDVTATYEELKQLRAQVESQSNQAVI